jgi:hypothetical protein
MCVDQWRWRISRNPVPDAITRFHAPFPGQAKIQVVMGQQDALHLPVKPLVVLCQPANLGSCITRQYQVADLGQATLRPAKGRHDLFAFGRRGCIAPQFHRRQYLAAVIQRHEAMLLPKRLPWCSADAFATLASLPRGDPPVRDVPQYRLVLVQSGALSLATTSRTKS